MFSFKEETAGLLNEDALGFGQCSVDCRLYEICNIVLANLRNFIRELLQTLHTEITVIIIMDHGHECWSILSAPCMFSLDLNRH